MKKLRERTKGLVSRSRTASPAVPIPNRQDPSNGYVKFENVALKDAPSTPQQDIAADTEEIADYWETDDAKNEAASRPGLRGEHYRGRETQKEAIIDVERRVNPPKPMLYRIEYVPQDVSEASLVGSFKPDERPRLSVTSLCESVEPGTDKLTATVVYRRRGHEDVPHLLNDRMTIDRDFFGFTPLYTPKGRIEADIIALTGLGGHAFGSWAVSPAEMWLRDFLPDDTPQARILIYGYDSRIKKRSFRSILSDYTNNFILKLTDMRREGRYELRPVILIGHSLGCLIIKEALIKSASSLGKNQQPLPVKSLIFFGAPHRGLDIVAIKILVDGTPSEDIVQELKKQSPTLTRLNDDFRHLHSDLEILTIFELEDTPSIIENADGEWQHEGPLVTMVEKDSAILYWANEQRIGCNADHRHIARVTRGQNGCYSQLRSFIRHSLLQEMAAQPDQLPSIAFPAVETSKSLHDQQDLHSEFFLAVRNGATNAIRKFLNRGVSIESCDGNARTALHLAAEWCSPDIIQLLLQAGSGTSNLDRHQWTPLHTAARFNSAYSIDLLSKAGADLSARTADECTPLHLAARYNPYPGVVKMLLDLGSAVDSREVNDWTPLHLATRYQTNFEVVKVLVMAGADVAAKNDEDYTPLHLASGHNSPEVLTLLLDSGADIEARDSDGWTPLKWAVRFGLSSNVKKLLNQSANMTAKSAAGVPVSNVAFVDGVSEDTRREIRQMLQDAEQNPGGESNDHVKVESIATEAALNIGQAGIASGGPCFDAPRCNVQPESISQIVENSLRDQILEWVSPIKYESAHNKIEKTAMSGTGQWLLQHDRYIAWRHSTTSSTLWLHGSMGSGKSCLAHVVINDIRTAINTTKGDWLVFFYCDGSDAEGAGQLTKTGNILRSFVKQFSNPGKAQRVMNAVVKSYNDNHHSADLTEQQSLDLILNMVCDSVSTIFIIDGLDECPSNVQRGLVSFITEVLAKATSVMKIFISSRATIEIKDLLSDLHVVEIDTVGHNRQDIISLVSTRISEAASSPGFRRIYHKGQDTQKQAVIDKLNEHAGGMFRWVQIAIDYLHGSLTFGEMSRRLAQLEHLEGLFDIYEVVYRNLMETRDEEDRQAIKTVLVFLLYGEDSQRRSQFAGGVRYVLEACAFRARNRPDVDLYTAEDIVALCPSLITLESYTDSLNLNWSFPHFSVREFLVTRHAEDYSRLNGNAFAAQLCMDVFVKLDVEALTDSLLVAYDAIYWISHLLRVVDSAHACGGLDGVLQKDEVFRRTLNAFLLNDYCTKAFLGWTSYMQSKKCKELEEFNGEWDCGSPLRAVIDVRPIIGLRKVHRGMTTIHFATLMGNSRAINWLIDQGLNINKRDDFGRNALFFASGGRPWKSFLKELRRLTPNQPVNIDRVSMIKTLIQYGIDVNARNALGETPIFCTIRADENDTCIRAKVKLLVEHGTDPLFVSKYQGTALEMAISRNYDGSLTSTIEYLSAVTLDQGISVNAEDRIKSGKTLFHNIAQYCNEETIRLWIRHGADQHIKDSQNKSALDYVKRQRIGNTSLIGYLESVIPELRNMNAGDDLSQTPFHNVVKHSTMETVQRWIEYGADPYLLNFDGKTAIDVAKEHGRDLVVRYLEAVGSRSV